MIDVGGKKRTLPRSRPLPARSGHSFGLSPPVPRAATSARTRLRFWRWSQATAQPGRQGYARNGRPPSSDAAPARPRPARRPPRPALPRRVGALRLARGRRGSRPGDLRARARPPAPAPQRGRSRLPPARAAQHLPEPEADREPPAASRPAARRSSTSSPTRRRASRRPRSRPASSTPRSPRSPTTSATSSSPSTSPASRTRRRHAPSGSARGR